MCYLEHNVLSHTFYYVQIFSLKKNTQILHNHVYEAISKADSWKSQK